MNIIRKHVQFITRALDKVIPQLPVMEVTKDRTPAFIASMIRKQWNVGSGVIENLTETLENRIDRL